MRLSNSAVEKYLDCPRAWWYHYRAGYRRRSTPATLLVGNVLHECVAHWLKGAMLRAPVDPVRMFSDAWTAAQKDCEIEYTTTQSPASIEATGKRLMELFPQAWEGADLAPVLGTDNQPVLERQLSVEIGNGVTLTGIVDAVCMRRATGESVLLDFKAPHHPYDPITIWQSDQLTHYQILADANASVLGVEQVQGVGFMQLIRRPVPKNNGRGPEVLPPTIIPRRTPAQVAEYREKVVWVVEQIRKGCFHKTPRKPHNTPCEMCDFVNPCVHGTYEGIVVPDAQQAAMA